MVQLLVVAVGIPYSMLYEDHSDFWNIGINIPGWIYGGIM